MICDVSTSIIRPWVPLDFRRRVFDGLHGLSHPGPRPSQRLISARFVWSGLKKDVRQWCRSCHSCQSSKIARHITAPVVRFAPAERRFGSVHVDLVGPLPPSQGIKYLFTMVDRFPAGLKLFPFQMLPPFRAAGRSLTSGWLGTGPRTKSLRTAVPSSPA